MKKIQLLGLSLLAGLLMYLAWHPVNFTFLIFVAWLPLLYIANTVSKKVTFFLYSLASLLVWNFSTTWWICNSTSIGGVAAIIANSLLMCLPLLAFFSIKKRFGINIGLLSFISIWMMFEYLHLSWQLSWPWLSIGNVFAGNTTWVQWYEFTGIAGGTLWVLLVNSLLFSLFFQLKKENRKHKKLLVAFVAAIIIIPIFYSMALGFHFVKGGESTGVVIVQPNIDPYQKFESTTTSSQIEKLIKLSEQSIDSTTKLVVWPETALSANVDVTEINSSSIYQPVFNFLKHYPNITLLTGIETHRFLDENSTSPYKQKTQSGAFYESYNAAITLNNNERNQFYIKSKLVPGVETLPTFLNILAPVFEQFGGTTGGYAKDSSAKVFGIKNSPLVAAPVICYESIYGEYIASYIRKGANIICIVTNDGWWKNTAGHKQHLAYAKLRAIETRTWIARSANTGISAVIDKYGNIIEKKDWGVAATIQYNFPNNNVRSTFYVRYGDYLYKIFSVVAMLLVLWNLYVKFVKKQ